MGDVLQRADVDALYAIAPNATAINLYGSTETQRAVSYVVLPRDVEALDPRSELGTGGLQKAALPVGRGYDGVQLILLADGESRGRPASARWARSSSARTIWPAATPMRRKPPNVSPTTRSAA